MASGVIAMRMRAVRAAVIVLGLGLGLAACESDDDVDAEDVGEEIDERFEEGAEEVEDALD
jgi:hypothetical protein